MDTPEGVHAIGSSTLAPPLAEVGVLPISEVDGLDPVDDVVSAAKVAPECGHMPRTSSAGEGSDPPGTQDSDATLSVCGR